MPCYHPLQAYKAKSQDADKISIVFSRPRSWRGETLDLPCGRCVGCRLERSRQWAVRCVHEASLYDRNCFLTLTYDDKHLPPNLSLDKTHFQKFMKRVRKKYGQGIRYYHCGEYGEEMGRPHYHALLFNHAFSDQKRFSERNGITIYTSDALSELWPYGFAVSGEVTFESAAYVARYIMKKITGDMAEGHYGGRLPEYTTMSRGSKKLGTGGIGKGWFDKFDEDVYPHDRVIVRGYPARPPRFYDVLLGRKDPALLAWLKINREKNGIKFVDDVLSDGRKVRVSDNSSIRLAVREVVKLAQVRQLKRPLEASI